MKIVSITTLLVFFNLSAFAKDLTCGFGEYPSQDWPERSGVVRQEVVGDEVELRIANTKFSYIIDYSISEGILRNTYTYRSHNLTLMVTTFFPYWNHSAYVAPIRNSNEALYCWFED